MTSALILTEAQKGYCFFPASFSPILDTVFLHPHFRQVPAFILLPGKLFSALAEEVCMQFATRSNRPIPSLPGFILLSHIPGPVAGDKYPQTVCWTYWI